MLSVILHKDSTIDRLRKILTQEIHALRKIFYKKIRLCAKSELFRYCGYEMNLSRSTAIFLSLRIAQRHDGKFQAGCSEIPCRVVCLQPGATIVRAGQSSVVSK